MKLAQQFRFKSAELGVFETKHAARVLLGFDHKCRIMGITRGLFSLIDLIHALLKQIGGGNVICCTWSAGIKDAHQIEWMAQSGIIKSFQIVTDRSFATRQPKYAVTLTELFGEANIHITDIHAKFVLMWNDEFKVCVRTSMNLNANKTCENFEIDEGVEIFDFYAGFINEVMDKTPQGWDVRRGEIAKILDKVFNENKTAAGNEIKKGSLKRGKQRHSEW